MEVANLGVGLASNYLIAKNLLTDIAIRTDKNSKGKVFAPWPGTISHYVQATSTVRWEDFDLSWADPENKYASFGNGILKEGVASASPPWLRR